MFVLGINERWFNDELLEDDAGCSYLEYPIKPLENSQCIKLSGDIVRMLAIFPLPYNIDFPIYQTIKLNHSDFSRLLNVPGWEISDISSLAQKRSNIFSLTFIPNEEHLELSGKMFNNDLIKQSLTKIRIYGKKSVKKKEVFSFSFVPMVILPPMREEQIITIFNSLAGDEKIIFTEILSSTTSKLRFIQFLIADKLAELFIGEMDSITRKNVSLLRSFTSLRLLFPEELIGKILDLAERDFDEIDLRYIRQEMPVKNIKHSYPIDDFVNINNSLIKPFLDIYYDTELAARDLAYKYGKNAFDNPDYKECIDRLNKGFSLMDLDGILINIAKEIRFRVLSMFLDRAIDNGIVVPITVIENGIVYRAFRHGEDVQFGQREERLCLEMINAFSSQVHRTDLQKIWIEKLLVFFLKIGETKFLEPIQTEINNYQSINGKNKNILNVASVKYFLHGPVVVRKSVDLNKSFNFSPCLDYSDKAYWLSRYFTTQDKTLKIDIDSDKYIFNKELFYNNNYNKKNTQEIVIDKELVKDAIEIGSVFGQLINNGENKIRPSLNSEELVALSCCCEPKDVIGALAAEINITFDAWTYIPTEKEKFFDEIRVYLLSAPKSPLLTDQALSALYRNPIWQAVKDGQRKFDWYLTKYPKLVIDRVTSDYTDVIYKGVWESFWSPNLDWTETSENAKTLELAKVEGIWLLCANIYFLIIEYCLIFSKTDKPNIEVVNGKIRNCFDNIKFFASHRRTTRIITYVNDFFINRNDAVYVLAIYLETIERIDKLILSAKGLIEDAEEFYAGYQSFPEITFFTDAIYIEADSNESLKTISNIFQNICFKIAKSSEEIKAKLKNLPNFDNTLLQNNGRWYVGSGKDAKLWLTRFANEVINNLRSAYKYKIFIFPDIPIECSIKIIDDYNIKYNNFWLFIDGFAEYIAGVSHTDGVIYTIREDAFSDLLEEVDVHKNYIHIETDKINLRLPNIRIFNVSQYKNTNIGINDNLINVVILTAIKEEYLAVRAHLVDITDDDRDDTGYETGFFEFNKKMVARVTIRECGPKNTAASQETERAIHNFRPDCILFVGIAGSRKPQDFGIGDVIFPEKIYSYEGGKAEKGSFKPRPDLESTSHTLFEIAKKERLKDDWKKLLVETVSEEIKADIGIIASGEQLIESYDSEVGKILTEHYNDTSVVEMEGFGFAKAASRQGRDKNKILMGVIRGISDVLKTEGLISESNGDDRRPGNSKKLASMTAAAFTYWLIYKLFLKPKVNT